MKGEEIRTMKKRIFSILLSISMVMSSVAVYADDVIEEPPVEVQQESSDSGSSEECIEITIVEVSEPAPVEAPAAETPAPEEVTAPEESAPVEAIAPEETILEEAAPADATTPEEVTEPEIVSNPEEIAEPETVSEPEEVAEPETVSEPEEVAEPEVASNPEEVSTQETVPNSEEVSAPEPAETASTNPDKQVVEVTPAQGSNSAAPEPTKDINASDYNKTLLDHINGVEDTYTKTTENISTSLSSTGRYNVNFTLKVTNDRTGENKTYIYTLSGFKSEEKAKEYASLLCVSPSATPDEVITYSDSDLVDTEKRPWSYWKDLKNDPTTTIYPAYDSNLCWAGSVADMLELSGWNKAERIDAHGNIVTDEDYLYDIFANNFTDYAGNQIYGVKWFFNGVNEPDLWSETNSKGWALLKNGEGYTQPFLRDYCVDDFVKSVAYPTKDNLADTLKTLDHDEDGDRCAIGLVFGYYTNNGTIRDGGHCVTIVGYSTDENGVPNSITIADSDSYNGGFPGYSGDTDRRSYQNMYTTYPIEFYDGTWHMMNFCDDSYDTKIDDLIVLKYYSDSTKNKLEQGGTKDLVNFYDFYPSYERTFKDNIGEIVETVYQGDLLNAAFALMDSSICERLYVDKISYRFIISKDGNVIRIVDADDEVEEGKSGAGYYYFTTIMDENDLLEPGEYYISVVVNYDKSVAEAYYNNNQSRKPIRFIVLKRVDENGEESYIVVPDSSNSDEENNSNDNNISVTEIIKDVIEYSAVTESFDYINNPEKVFEFHFSNGFTEMNISDADIADAELVFDYSVTGDLSNPSGGNISSNISITKDDFKIVRNADGTISIVFSNEFMKKLPKGTHYFKIRIGGKVRIFKIEIK